MSDVAARLNSLNLANFQYLWIILNFAAEVSTYSILIGTSIKFNVTSGLAAEPEVL